MAVNEATQQLYNAALLGASIAKQSGETLGGLAAQNAATRAEGERRATLRAGVASGKIKPQSLSASDAALLGQSLKPHAPGGSGGVFGFLGHLAGTAAKETGQIVSSFGKVPEGLLTLGKAAGEFYQGKPGAEAKLVGAQAKQIYETTTHPTEHPIEALLNIAALASGGSSAAVKAAGVAERAGATSRLISKIAKAGEVARPSLESPSVGEKVAEGFRPGTAVKAGEIPRYYSTNPFTRFAVQKPIDALMQRVGSTKIPFTSTTPAELRFDYQARRLGNRARARLEAGTTEQFTKPGPVQDFLKSVREMKAKTLTQKGYQYQFEAMYLRARGINTTEKLDEYSNQINQNMDVLANPDDPKIAPQEEAAAKWRANTLYQDPEFRKLVLEPTDDMRRMAYNMRRMELQQSRMLMEEFRRRGVSPETSERAAFGPFSVLSGKTIEEVAHELPEGQKLDNRFAKGLQQVEDAFLRPKNAEEIAPGELPTSQDLADMIPFGDPQTKLDVVEKTLKSFGEDLRDEKGGVIARSQGSDYLPGKTMFEKMAVGMQHFMGMPEEQAQAFARGIPLGEELGEIMPSYFHSQGGYGMKFGVPAEKPLERLLKQRQLGEEAPVYHEFARPFRPRDINAAMATIGPKMAYTKDADYTDFLNGTMRVDPEMIARTHFQIIRDILQKKLSDPVIERLGLKGEDGNIRWWNGQKDLENHIGPEAASRWMVVPVNMYRNFFRTAAELEGDVAEILTSNKSPQEMARAMEDLADERAQEFVAGERDELGTKGPRYGQGVALPVNFVKTMLDHMKIAEQGNAATRAFSWVLSRWKYMQLQLSPAWLLRTTIGHGIIALVDGTLNPRHWFAALRYPQEGKTIAPGIMDRLMFGKKYGDEVLNPPKELPPGVNQGGQMTQEMAEIGRGKVNQNPWARFIGRNVHTITNFQRRAIFFRKLDVMAKQDMANLGREFDHPGGFWNRQNIDAVLDPNWTNEVLQHPNLIEDAFDQLSNVSYTFGEMSPWERRIIKVALPFWGWYKFISKFVWKMPLNYPGRTAAIHMLGNLGQEEVDQNMGTIPNYLENALWLNHGDMSKARYINLYGLNPFADVANPLGKEGMFQGVIRMGQVSPLLQAGLAAYGIDPLTGGLERVSPESGYESDRYGNLINVAEGTEAPGIFAVHAPQRFIGTLLREFPEIRAIELGATHGNPVFPESIPLFDEKPIGVNPVSRKGGNLVSGLEQEFGVQPRTIDLGKYQTNLLKSILEAQKKNPKTIAKEQAKREEPE